MPDGYGFYWNGIYWGSLTTGPARGEVPRYDIYLGVVGANTREHIWIKVQEDDFVMGTRLTDRGQHLSPEVQSEGLSTEVLARVRLQFDPTQPSITAELADVFSNSAFSAAPVTSQRTESSRDPARVDLRVPPEARDVELEVAVCRSQALAATGSLSTQFGFLPFGGASPVGVAMRVSKWSTGT